MSTSGTIGTTKINTAKLLDKAIRRCGLEPNILTPELVEQAKESLFMLLLSIANRGLNLWCIDHRLLPLISGQATYTLPTGTLDILNVLHCTPTLADIQSTSTSVGFDNFTLVDASTIVRAGFIFSILPTEATVTLEYSTDGLVWNTGVKFAVDVLPGQYQWVDLPIQATAAYWRLSHSTGALTTAAFCVQVREITITPFNRDDYAAQPNKTLQSGIVTNYFFEKKIDPQFTCWPVTNSSVNHISTFLYRQVQDVGKLTQELEIPSRWLEAISWQLAYRISFELPQVQQPRRQELKAMVDAMTMEVEGGETDGMPIYFAPRIGVYTK